MKIVTEKELPGGSPPDRKLGKTGKPKRVTVPLFYGTQTRKCILDPTTNPSSMLDNLVIMMFALLCAVGTGEGEQIDPNHTSEKSELKAPIALYIVEANGGETPVNIVGMQICARGFSDGLAAIRIGRRFGYMRRDGSLAISAGFVAAGYFSEGMAPVMTEGLTEGGRHTELCLADRRDLFYTLITPVSFVNRWGYIRPDGNMVIEAVYTEAGPMVHGRAWVVCLTGKKEVAVAYACIDPDGNVVISPDVSIISARPFREGIAAVARGLDRPAWGYVDRSGRQVIAPKFSWAGDFHNGVARVIVDGNANQYRVGYINKAGSWVIEPRFDDGRDMSEGLVAVKQGGRWGFVDANAVMVIDTNLENAFEFSQGLAPVRKEGRWGYIDHKGNWAIQPQFTGAGTFRKGLACVSVMSPEIDATNCVRIGRRCFGYINTKGQFVVAPKCLGITDLSDDGVGIVAK